MRKPSQKIQSMLEELRSFGGFIETNFETVFANAFDSLTSSEIPEEEQEKLTKEAIQIINILTLIISYFVKEEYHLLEIENVCVQELEWKEPITLAFLTEYKRNFINKGVGISTLVDSSIHVGYKLTGFEWTANKLVATDGLYKANKDEYTMKIGVRDQENHPKELNFKMNLEQLTELHQTLQQALKIIEVEATNFTKNL